jgi:hypothetical protein
MPFGNSSSFNVPRPRIAAGSRVNPKYGLITGVPADVNNKFVPGAGVGAQNIFTRRAKNRYATSCAGQGPNYRCGRFYMSLGLHPHGNGQYIAF